MSDGIIENDEKTKLDIYRDMMKESLAWCRHHEQLRSNVCSVILVVSGAILTLAEFTDREETGLALGIFIMLIGIFGILFIYKHYQIYVAYFSLYREYLGEISKVVTFGADKIFDRSYEFRDKQFPPHKLFERIKLHYFWMMLMLIVVAAGAYVSFDSLPS